jgi:hypothetical protein
MGYNQDRESDNNKIEIDDEMLRLSALSMAIESKCGQDYTERGQMIFSDDKFVTAAAKFYLFLKEVTKNENV